MILFDLRLEHRGGANRGTVKRPILYLGYTNRWCGALHCAPQSMRVDELHCVMLEL